jgi:hypothetical protein
MCLYPERIDYFSLFFRRIPNASYFIMDTILDPALTQDDFDKLREKRRLQMQKAAALRQKNLLNGHGRYMELSDQKEFFEASKNSATVIVHFYRTATV